MFLRTCHIKGIGLLLPEDLPNIRFNIPRPKRLTQGGKSPLQSNNFSTESNWASEEQIEVSNLSKRDRFGQSGRRYGISHRSRRCGHKVAQWIHATKTAPITKPICKPSVHPGPGGGKIGHLFPIFLPFDKNRIWPRLRDVKIWRGGNLRDWLSLPCRSVKEEMLYDQSYVVRSKREEQLCI